VLEEGFSAKRKFTVFRVRGRFSVKGKFTVFRIRRRFPVLEQRSRSYRDLKEGLPFSVYRVRGRFSVKGKFTVFRIRRRFSVLEQKSRSYRDLRVWQEAIDFVKDIYLITAQFPATEVYGLTNQIRRAAVSIPSNIAEGQGRHSIKEFSQFLGIALGSIAELETQLIISAQVGYLPQTEVELLLARSDDLRKMIKSLSNSLQKN
jgi:four helix bundle protein